MRLMTIAGCLISAQLITASVWAADSTPWSYEGDNGPQVWGQLDMSFSLCEAGKNQSPIDITDLIDAQLEDIELNYKSTPHEIVNNGHTIQANFKSDDHLIVDGQSFELKQIHFHSPSENTINGKSFPLEAHLVHADMDGNLAVVGVMFEKGKKNPWIEQLWAEIPQNEHEHQALKAPLAINEILPDNKDYYRFNGSLTTPPCSEGVRWLVMKNALQISTNQVKSFSSLFPHDTNRPLQARNARPVLK